jgi:hypothetical protein
LITATFGLSGILHEDPADLNTAAGVVDEFVRFPEQIVSAPKLIHAKRRFGQKRLGGIGMIGLYHYN